MGGGGGSSTKSTSWGMKTGWEKQEPWDVQIPYLKQAFSEAQSQFDKNKAAGPWSGDYLVPSTQEQYDAGRAVLSAADRSEQWNNALLDSSRSSLEGGGGYITDAATGLRSLSGDQTQSIIDAANQYRQGFDVPSLVQAAMRDANRNAAESGVPNLYRQAAASGGLNSSRAALAQGVIDRGLAEKSADLSAQYGNQAWLTGLTNAQTDIARRLQAIGGLGNLGLGALNAGQQGYNIGINNAGKIATARMGGAEYLKALEQNNLSNELMKYDQNRNYLWNQLANYYNIIGNRSWGGTRTYAESEIGGSESQTKNSSSPLSTAGSILGAAGSLFGGGGSGGILGGLKLFS